MKKSIELMIEYTNNTNFDIMVDKIATKLKAGKISGSSGDKNNNYTFGVVRFFAQNPFLKEKTNNVKKT